MTDDKRQRVDDMIGAERQITYAKLLQAPIVDMILCKGLQRTQATGKCASSVNICFERQKDVCSNYSPCLKPMNRTFSPNFLTEDMAWVYQYNAETKKQSMDLDLKKFKSQKSAAKVMVHVFWDERGVIFMDFYCLVMLNSKQ